MIRFTDMQAAGYIPSWLDEGDSRGAVEQIDANYIGSWRDFEGFALDRDADADETAGKYRLLYPDDPPTIETSRAYMRGELIVVFNYDWVAVVQPDGKFRVARID